MDKYTVIIEIRTEADSHEQALETVLDSIRIAECIPRCVEVAKHLGGSVRDCRVFSLPHDIAANPK